MPNFERVIVTNTTPLITLSIATGGLDVFRELYDRVIVPFEVSQEMLAVGKFAPGVRIFENTSWLERCSEPKVISQFLNNSLDLGEASVIQTALDLHISKVCIDEKVGRRVARLNELTVTGSIGILIKAKQNGFPIDVNQVIARLRNHGIWIGRDVELFFRQHA